MKSAQTATSAVAEIDAAADEHQALVERIASSQTFWKSQKLREFFLFVCDCSSRKGASEEVKEQQIGVHVFHRRPGYNTSEDSIVRVQARELRKRLATYFETEGKHEPLIITIPKGGYLPVFIPAESRDQVERESEISSRPEPELVSHAVSITNSPTAGHFSHAQWAVLAVFGGALLFSAGWLFSAMARRPSPDVVQAIATHRAFSFYDDLLGSIGRNSNNTLLVLSNPKVLLYSGADSLGTTRLLGSSLVSVPPELRKQLTDARNLGEDTNQPTYLAIESNTYTGMGEAANAYNIGRLMTLIGRSVRLTQGRFLNWDAAMQQNLIVLGSPDINTWTHGNLSSSTFVFVASGIRNNAPLQGEKALYPISYDSSGHPTEDYGLISMSTTAAGSRVLMLAGRASAGTYGVGDFFTNPDQMRVVYERLKAASQGKAFPNTWEALIHIKIRDDLPVDTTLVTVRTTGPSQ